MWRAIMLVVAAVLAQELAMAQDRFVTTALDLKQACESADLAELSFCRGFVGGFADAYQRALIEVNKALAKQGGRYTDVCMPEGMILASEQVRLVFVRWTAFHPEKLHIQAGAAVRWALMDAFPCT